MSSKKTMYKCPECGELVHIDESVKIKNRRYHIKCAEIYQQRQTRKEERKKQLEEEKRQNEADRQELLKYIASLQDVAFPDGMILKMVKNFKEQGYTYKGMLMTLKYYYELKENPIIDYNNVIGIIPYVYNEAKEYYTKVLKARKNNKRLIASTDNPLYEKKKYVKIKVKKPQYKNDDLIDIEAIE